MKKIDISFYKRLAALALPVILQNFLSSFVNILDTIMVGRLGAVSIAAAGLGNQIFFLLMMILFGISSGASIFFAQYWGKKDYLGIHRAMGIALTAALFVALLFVLGAQFFPQKIIGLYSADSEVIKAGAVYLRAISLSYPVLAITLVVQFALRSIEQARFPLFATACALVVNAVCNWALIFGVSHNGTQIIPSFGIEGAGWATAISRAVECALMLIFVYAKKLPVAGKLKRIFSFDRYLVRRFLKITTPVILNETFWGLGITMQNSVLAHAGTLALASFNIAGTVSQLTWVFFMGMGNATAVIIGKRIGQGDEKGARQTAARCAVFMPLTSVLIGALLFPLSLALPFFFDVEHSVITQAQRMIYLIMFLYPVRSFNLCVLIGVMRAGGDTVYCLISDIVFLWIFSIPLGAALAFIFHAEPWIIFAGLTAEDALKTLICFPRLKSGKWLHNVVER
jgi:putative MATE family efflux protein